MSRLFFIMGTILLLTPSMFAQDTGKKFKELTPSEKRVIIGKGTERAFTGKYNDFYEEGTYICKQCEAPLYNSSDKFKSHCGWPSFDDEIEGAIKQIPDADGMRTEIVCAECDAHLGHVFLNEGFTKKNIRHCVNSISMEFIAEKDLKKRGEAISRMKSKNGFETAYFAEGCFWGTEYWMEKQKGVISAESGYAGGNVKSPDYYDVVKGNTGHVETVKVTFDPNIISYEELVKTFFNTHDPTQTNGQGPDIGTQYLSVIFYTSELQKQIAEKYKKILRDRGYNVATQIKKAGVFYPAEAYHQDYYGRKGSIPYCHIYKNKF